MFKGSGSRPRFNWSEPFLYPQKGPLTRIPMPNVDWVSQFCIWTCNPTNVERAHYVHEHNCFYIKINKLNRQWLYLLYNWVALWPVNVYLLFNRKQRRFQIQILTIKILSRTLVSRIQSAYLFQSVLSSVSSQLSRVGRPHQTGLEHQCRGGCKTVGTKRDGGRGWPCFYAQSAGVGQGALLAPVLLRRNYKDSRSRHQTISVVGFVKDNGNQDTFLFWF